MAPAVHILSCLKLTEPELAGLNEGLRPFGVAPQVARYVAERTDPDEPILVVGSEPEIYYYAGRSACTRLVFTYPMTGPYPYAARLRQEFLIDLEHHQPRYVIHVPLASSLTEWPDELPPLLEPVATILERDYVTETTVVDGLNKGFLFVVYRRKQR